MGTSDEPLKPEPFIKPITLVLLVSLLAIALSGIAIYESNETNNEIKKLSTQLNNTNNVINYIVSTRTGPTAFDQDVLAWANQTNTRLQALEEKK